MLDLLDITLGIERKGSEESQTICPDSLHKTLRLLLSRKKLTEREARSVDLIRGSISYVGAYLKLVEDFDGVRKVSNKGEQGSSRT